MTTTKHIDSKVWRLSPWAWGSILGALGLVCVFSFESLKYMVQLWSSKEEYGYAYLIPGITLFMIWQKRETLERLRFDGSWVGLILVGWLVKMAVFGLHMWLPYAHAEHPTSFAPIMATNSPAFCSHS